MRGPNLLELPQPPRGKKGWPWTEAPPQLPDAMPNGQPWPRISIVTPSYNQGRFIEETIRSVLLQGYPDLEYIIIDGGSTDNSVEIIQKYDKWLTYWVSEPDRGQSHAINKGFEKATGEIYGWLNSDDYLLKDALKNVALAYDAHPDAGGWFGRCLQVNIDHRELSAWSPKRLDAEGLAEWRKNMVGQPACFFSAKAWKKCGPLAEDLHFAMDFDFWLKVAKAFPVQQVHNAIAAARVHRHAKTHRDIGRSYAERYLVQIRHGYEDFAIQDIIIEMNHYGDLLNKLHRASMFPLLRPFMPIARMVWKRLL